jgi:hypothetical protein
VHDLKQQRKNYVTCMDGIGARRDRGGQPERY